MLLKYIQTGLLRFVNCDTKLQNNEYDYIIFNVIKLLKYS